jgi:hypothetical protein
MPVITLPRRRPSGLDLPVALGAALGLILLGLFCARLATSHYGKPAIEAIIGVPVLIVIARRPAVAVIALLAVVSSTFAYGVLPRVNLPGHPPINVGDLMLAAAVGGTLWRRPWQSWPPPARRYFLALALMLLLASVATIKTSLLGSSQVRDAAYGYRNFLYLGVALTIAIELSGDMWRPFLNAMVAFAGAISILAVLAVAVPSVASALQSVSPTTVYSSSALTAAGGVNVGGIARIRLQGLFFIYSMLIPTFVMTLVIKDRWRGLRAVALVLMLGAVAVSLNRNMYAGAIIGILVTAVLGGERVRYRIGLVILAAVVSIVLVAFTAITPAITAQVGKRAGTVLSPSQILSSSSAQDRAYELTFAIPSIERHPWFGVGPRQPYGAVVSPYSGRPRFFVQDLYVDIATDFGIPTALAFLLIPAVCFWFGLRQLRWAKDPLDRALLAAAIGTLVAMVLSCLVDTFVQDPSTTVAFGTAGGLVLGAGLHVRSRASEKGAADVRTT